MKKFILLVLFLPVLAIAQPAPVIKLQSKSLTLTPTSGQGIVSLESYANYIFPNSIFSNVTSTAILYVATNGNNLTASPNNSNTPFSDFVYVSQWILTNTGTNYIVDFGPGKFPGTNSGACVITNNVIWWGKGTNLTFVDNDWSTNQKIIQIRGGNSGIMGMTIGNLDNTQTVNQRGPINPRQYTNFVMGGFNPNQYVTILGNSDAITTPSGGGLNWPISNGWFINVTIVCNYDPVDCYQTNSNASSYWINPVWIINSLTNWGTNVALYGMQWTGGSATIWNPTCIISGTNTVADAAVVLQNNLATSTINIYGPIVFSTGTINAATNASFIGISGTINLFNMPRQSVVIAGGSIYQDSFTIPPP